ncbi:hypothetical protein [Thermomonospora catenispora]|uniref:hypothetical protein n=1 Tax=Thermomonospora catenispora TaxID=2493090 RepID=UPI0011205F68|nr:hypothetical protein [Thermomonospora catenispora]TNY36576.1 hypothetical protein EIO00_12325 [Thermomonospora catenispora]
MTRTTMTWLGDDTAPGPSAPAPTDSEDALRTPEAENAARREDRDAAEDAARAEEGAPDAEEPADAARVEEVEDERAAEGPEKEGAERRAGKAAAEGDRDDAPTAKAANGKRGDGASREGAGGRTGRRRFRPSAEGAAKAAVLAALAAAIAVAGLQWHRANGMAEEEAVRTAVRTRAAEFGVALLSYDHNDLKAARERVMSMASDDFAKTYDVAFTGGLEGVIGRLKADATATVRNVYVSEVNDTAAKAIVVLDSEVKSTAGTRRVLGSYLEMNLVRQNGQWKVTEVSSIGSINESMSGSDDRSPSPTPSSSPRR